MENNWLIGLNKSNNSFTDSVSPSSRQYKYIELNPLDCWKVSIYFGSNHHYVESSISSSAISLNSSSYYCGGNRENVPLFKYVFKINPLNEDYRILTTPKSK